MKLFTLLLLAIALLQSCSKDPEHFPGPPVEEPVLPDTLSASWTKISGFTQAFYDIAFAGNSIGYLIGDSGLYKSTDGGFNWKHVSFAVAGDQFLVVVFASNLFTIREDTLFKSFDGGATFSTQIFDSLLISKPFFVNATTGYLAGYGQNRLFKTTDGGHQWVAVPNINRLYFSSPYIFPFFINETTGWISNGGDIYYSNGDVSKWQPVTMLNTTGLLVPFAVDEKTIFLSGRSQNGNGTDIYKSSDGGRSFTKTAQLASRKMGWPDIHFIDAANGYALAGTSIFATADGGFTWHSEVSMGNNNIVELYFADNGHGWACGANGTILVMKK